MCEAPVYRHPRNPEFLRDCRGADPFIHHRPNAVTVYGPSATAVGTLSNWDGLVHFSPARNSRRLPFAIEGPLKFRGHPQREQKDAGRDVVSDVDGGFEHTQLCGFLAEPFNDLNDVAHISSQTIQTVDNDDVPRPNEFEKQGKLGSPVHGFSRHPFLEDHAGPSGHQDRALPIKVLIGR